jgi:hypothetical protein
MSPRRRASFCRRVAAESRLRRSRPRDAQRRARCATHHFSAYQQRISLLRLTRRWRPAHNPIDDGLRRVLMRTVGDPELQVLLQPHRLSFGVDR